MHSPRRRSFAILASILRLRQPSPVCQRLSSLPVELQAKIVNEAVDDVRWVDLTTVESLMLTSKAMYELAAPTFWRVITLGGKSATKLDRFLRIRPRILELVRVVQLGNLPEYCDAVLRLLRVEALRVWLMADYQPGAPGWVTFDRLARTEYRKLRSFEATFFRSSLSRHGSAKLPQVLPSPSVLSYLDPARLTRLHLHLGTLGPADVECMRGNVGSFRLLENLSLAADNAASLPFPAIPFAPLRTLHLAAGFQGSIDTAPLVSLLNGVSGTLEYLDLSSSFDPPLRPIHLPRLRQLKLGSLQPVDLLSNFDCPAVEALELVDSGSWNGGRPRIGLLPSLKAMPHLETYIYSEDIVSVMHFKEVEPCFQLLQKRGVQMLDRTIGAYAADEEDEEDGQDDPRLAWSDLLEDIDDWTTPWRQGGQGYARSEDWEWTVVE
ncbi:hypothetical protein JCM8097_003263 [Rhodosporidiobolus ruineniae]